MTLYTQSSFSGECGNISLYHALNLQGLEVSLHDVRRATGLGPIEAAITGLDDAPLIAAANKFPVKVVACEFKTYGSMIRQLNKHLKQRYTCIISTRDAGHWAVIHHKHKLGYETYDSLREHVIEVVPYKQLRRWICPYGTFYYVAIRKKRSK